jgi:hypothetical protein
MQGESRSEQPVGRSGRREEQVMAFAKMLGADGGEQVLPAHFTHLDAVSAGKKNPAFVTALAKDLSHPVKVHDGTAVDPDEFPGIKRAG